LLGNLLAVEFDRTARRAGRVEMGAKAGGRGAIRQWPDNEAIACRALAMLARCEWMHSAQQRPKIGLHRKPTLADRLDRGTTAEIQSEIILCRWGRFGSRY
jgi:hypothetical protein